MLIHILLVAHIAVLGYWLGSELVINANFRFVSWARNMPFSERDGLLDHVLDVDQHVRYALILQLGLGTALAGLLGYLPGGGGLAASAGVLTVAWLALVEATHRLRKAPVGALLARIDSGIRYFLIAALPALCALALLGPLQLPVWLAVKLALFGGVILCGLGIRLAIIRYYQVWRSKNEAGAQPGDEDLVRQRYWQATWILMVLWLLIAAMLALSLWKP